MPLSHLKSREPRSVPTAVGDVRRLELCFDPRQELTDSRKLYAGLKEDRGETFYDAKTELWTVMDEEDSFYVSEIQFIDILINAAHNPQNSRQLILKKYAQLVKLGFLQIKDNFPFWLGSVPKEDLRDPKGWRKSIHLNSNLWALLAWSQVDKAEVRKKFCALKEKGVLFDKTSGTWSGGYIDGIFTKTVTTIDSQLLAICVEAQFDKPAAERAFQTLKESDFYDRETNLWCPSSDSKRATTEHQLLGILTEQIFDPQAARRRYLSIRNSVLFDAENERWYLYADLKTGFKYPKHTFTANLLDALVLSQFENLAAHPEETPAQPEALTF